jgi:hypothetical protein
MAQKKNRQERWRSYSTEGLQAPIQPAGYTQGLLVSAGTLVATAALLYCQQSGAQWAICSGRRGRHVWCLLCCLADTTVEKTLQRLGSKFELVPLPAEGSMYVKPASVMFELDGEHPGVALLGGEGRERGGGGGFPVCVACS